MRRFLRHSTLGIVPARELSQKFIDTHVRENLSDKSVNTQANRVRHSIRNEGKPPKDTNTSLGPRQNIEQQERIFKEQLKQGQIKPDAKGLYNIPMHPSWPIRKREADMNAQRIGDPQPVKGVRVGLDPKGDWHHLGDTFKKGGKISKKKTIKRKK